jgi:outer membrane autotransporter protein
VVDSFQLATSADAYGRMSYPSKAALRGRLGLLLGQTTRFDEAGGEVNAWVRGSVWSVFRGPGTAVFYDLEGRNGAAFNGDIGRTWFAADAGLSGMLTKSVQVFANAGYEAGADFTGRAFTGRIGAQISW